MFHCFKSLSAGFQTFNRFFKTTGKTYFSQITYLLLAVILAFTTQTFPSLQTHKNSQQITEHLSWPTGKPAPVIKSFKAPKAKWLSGRRGIELAYRESAPIYATAAGEVYYVGVINKLPIISVLHKNGIRSTYLPVKSELKKGDKVTCNQVIGKLESPEKNGHLKFGLKLDDGHYLNPMPYLYGPIILLQSDIPITR